MKVLHTGITEPKGFQSVGKHVGLKSKKKDLAIIYTEKPAVWAGVFTKNIVKAAPIIRNIEIFNNKNKIHAVVINSGNANACTGEKGIVDNQTMADTLAKCLNLKSEEVITSSTGVIGTILPIDKIELGIKNSHHCLSSNRQASVSAAAAIMTTDTVSKEISVSFEIDSKTVKIGGMAKGSGMIHPNMATMLSFLTTDVNISREMLINALKCSTNDSYNMISVDGDTSTNDMVCIMANGEAENNIINCKNDDYYKFKEALDVVNKELAKMIVKDGEGASKFIEVQIHGACSKEDSKILCQSILNSSLVKTAFFGEDANWGRIMCAMGYSGAKFDQDKVTIKFKSKFGNITLMDCGTPIIFDEEIAAEVLKAEEIVIHIKLQDGTEKAVGWGCDLSYEYVRINGEYRS